MFSCRYALRFEFLLDTICQAFRCLFLTQNMKIASTGTPMRTTAESLTSVVSMKAMINTRLMISRTALIRPLLSMSQTELT